MLIRKTISSLGVAIATIFIGISLFSSITLAIKGREAQEKVSSAFIQEIVKESSVYSNRMADYLSHEIIGKNQSDRLAVIIRQMETPVRLKEYVKETICDRGGSVLYQQSGSAICPDRHDDYESTINQEKLILMERGGGTTVIPVKTGNIPSLIVVTASPIRGTDLWFIQYSDMVPIQKALLEIFTPLIEFRSFSLVLLSISSLGFFIFIVVFSHLTILKTNRMEKELIKANHELTRLSSLDGLTGISNRRRFDEYLDAELQRARRNGNSISLIMADVDHFKKYNDTYGHQMGDQCLKRVAGVFAETCRRPADLPARYGGEEFAVILPDTDTNGAYRVAEDIRTEILRLAIPHRSSTVESCVTVSIGIATFIPSQSSTIDEIIQLADQALYTAKRGGRNRVIPSPVQEG